MSAPFFEAMIELQEEKIIGNHELRSIALLADGKHFSAGIDLNYASTVIGKPGRSLYGVKYWQRAYQFWHDCNLPVVVGIQGACMGTAIELAAACDFRIAAENARFALREVQVGISTDMGGTTRLTKLIGPGMTKLMALTCEDIYAQEAYRIGLVERLVSLEELESTTLGYARKMAELPPSRFRCAKSASTLRPNQATHRGFLPRRFREYIPSARRIRRRLQGRCSKSARGFTPASDRLRTAISSRAFIQ